MIKKIKDKLQYWKGKLLSFGGNIVLINNVLQSMPLYLLSAMDPTKKTINKIYEVFVWFFWSNKEEGRSKHWSKWLNIYLPKEERGLGFRSLVDVSKSLFTKLWWKFRVTGTSWSTFMWNKYWKKRNSTQVIWKRGSQLWKLMS